MFLRGKSRQTFHPVYPLPFNANIAIMRKPKTHYSFIGIIELNKKGMRTEDNEG